MIKNANIFLLRIKMYIGHRYPAQEQPLSIASALARPDPVCVWSNNELVKDSRERVAVNF